MRNVLRQIFFCAALMVLWPQWSWGAEVFGVKQVISGHLVELSDGRRVRLIGIEAGSEQSTAFVKDFIEGKGVLLEFDEEKEDDAGNTLAYLVMIETSVNATILLAGYGTPVSMPPNTRYDGFFQRLYQDAVENKRGLWKN